LPSRTAYFSNSDEDHGTKQTLARQISSCCSSGEEDSIGTTHRLCAVGSKDVSEVISTNAGIKFKWLVAIITLIDDR
jgi:hypothetical protein